ncbi:MAG: phosphatase PAP2 family protein [Bacteroidales bacterium]|nr:phosphatase PAP2 family protein [Bacteroidales bacterium]
MIEYLDTLDTKLFAFLNGIHSPFFDRIMWFVSGVPQWFPLYLLVIGWVIFRYRRRSILIILALILLIVLSDQISVQIKLSVDRLRPCKDPDIRPWVHIVKGYCSGRFGFVSSHAANSFAWAVFTALLLKNRYYTFFILIWATVISYSRIYLGVHFPGDVLGGILLGVMLGYGVYWLYGFAEKKIKKLYKGQAQADACAS